MSKTNRREFLAKSASLLAMPLIFSALPGALIASPMEPVGSKLSPLDSLQAEWRYCEKCYGIFWNGYENKGRCPAGGGHKNPVGDNYFLPITKDSSIHKAQADWRWCDKCYALFFNGYRPNKGKCPAGGGHNASGSFYRIPYDVPSDASNRGGYRFCTKCHWMFWDGYKAKGVCPGGGGNTAAGYHFVLPHDVPQTFSTRVPLHTDGWAPIRGWTEIWANIKGDYIFSGHIHNSGAINIRFTLVAALISASGQAFTFSVNNKRVDGTEVLIGRNRDYDWKHSSNNPNIAALWGDLQRSKVTTKLVASSAFGSGVTNFAKKIVAEAYTALPEWTGRRLLLKPAVVFVIEL